MNSPGNSALCHYSAFETRSRTRTSRTHCLKNSVSKQDDRHDASTVGHVYTFSGPSTQRTDAGRFPKSRRGLAEAATSREELLVHARVENLEEAADAISLTPECVRDTASCNAER